MQTLSGKIRYLSGFLLIFCFCTGAFAQAKISGVLRWPGSSIRSVTGNSDHLIHTHGNLLRIFQRTDDTLLAAVPIALQEGLRGLAHAPDQNRIYLACGTDGLRILNLENPTHPVVTAYDINPQNAGKKDASGRYIAHTFAPMGLFYLEKRLYVADFMYGLRVFDVSIPEEPKEIAAYRQGTGDASGGYLQVFVHREAGRTLISVLDKYHGLHLFDAADQQAGDAEKKWTPAASFDMRSKTYYGQISLVTGLFAEGPRVFVTDEENGLTILHLFNESQQRDSLKIVKEGQCKTPGKAMDLVVDTHLQRAFIADTEKGLSVVGLESLFDNDPATRVQDSDFKGAESRADDLGGSHSLWKDPMENALYLASYAKDLSRIRLGSPQIEKTFPPALDFRQIQRQGSTLILSDHGHLRGFRVMDITHMLEPDSDAAYFPRQLAEKGTQAPAQALRVSGNRLFTAEGPKGLGVYDLTDPAAPLFLAQITAQEIPGLDDVRDVVIRDALAFCLIQGKGIAVLDLANPAQPVQKNLISEYDQAVGLFLDASTLWIADRQKGLVALSVTHPETPEKIRSLALTAPQALWADETRVLVAEGPHGLFVYEKTSGLSSQVALKDGAEAAHVFGLNHFAFVSCGQKGVQMIDLTASQGPETVASLDSYGKTLAGLGLNQDLYMAEATGGLAVLRFVLGDEASPAPLPSIRTSSSSCFLDSLIHGKKGIRP